MTTANQTTDTPAAPDDTDEGEWVFPLDVIIDKHRERITPEHEDFIPFMVEAWRIGDQLPRWTTIVDQTDDTINAREAGLKAIEIMAAATDADYMVFAYDTHMTTLQTNPKTGEPWKPGEMQAMCDEEGFCETGLMRDNLVVTVARRSDRKLYTKMLPYHFHKGEPIMYEEQTVSEWEENAEGRMDGRIPSVMRAAVSQPTLDELLRNEIGGGVGSPEFKQRFGAYDLEEARCQSLMAGVQTLLMLAALAGLPGMYVFLIPAFTDREKEIMERYGMSVGNLADLIKDGEVAPEAAGDHGDGG